MKISFIIIPVFCMMQLLEIFAGSTVLRQTTEVFVHAKPNSGSYFQPALPPRGGYTHMQKGLFQK